MTDPLDMTGPLDTPLTRALALAGEVVERRNTIPILSNVVLSVFADTLYVEATDMDIEIAVVVGPQGANLETDALNVTVPLETLRRIADRRAILALVENKGRNLLSVLTDGDASFELPTLPVSDMPRLTKHFEVAASFTLQADYLREALRSVASGVSFEETRYYLNGVFMHVIPAGTRAEPLISFAATDGHRLYRALRPLPAGAEGLRGGVIIPRKVVHLLIKALESMPDEEVTVEVSADTNPRLRVVAPGLTINSKTIDGTFPDYVRVIPQRSDGSLACVASDLGDLAQAARCIMEDKQVRSVVITFTDDGPRISANTRGDGTMSAPVLGVTSGKLPASIGLNASYLDDALAPFGDDVVTISFGDSAAPVLLKRESDAGLIVVLMPTRV